MIQIAQAGLRWSNQDHELPELQQQFGSVHCVQLTQFLEPRLVAMIGDRIGRAEFHEQRHQSAGRDQALSDKTVLALLHLLVNDDRVLAAVRAITQANVFGFSGRVYRMIPGSGHHDSWHSDATSDRIVGISINLSPGTYSGGLFQIRRADAEQVLCEVANTGLGDAILFRIDREFVHRVSPLEGHIDKVAFAGWFSPHTEFASMFKDAKRVGGEAVD